MPGFGANEGGKQVKGKEKDDEENDNDRTRPGQGEPERGTACPGQQWSVEIGSGDFLKGITDWESQQCLAPQPMAVKASLAADPAPTTAASDRSRKRTLTRTTKHAHQGTCNVPPAKAPRTDDGLSNTNILRLLHAEVIEVILKLVGPVAWRSRSVSKKWNDIVTHAHGHAIKLARAVVRTLQPDEAWRFRSVSRTWRWVVDEVHKKQLYWYRAPRRIAIPVVFEMYPNTNVLQYMGSSLPQAQLLRVAYLGIRHIKSTLRKRTHVVCEYFAEAQKVRETLTKYYTVTTGKSIETNCVAVFKRRDANWFVLNFWFQPEVPDGPEYKFATDLMKLVRNMHAEVRVLHSGCELISVDKAMCIFCAMTFYVHEQSFSSKIDDGCLAWYTFSPSIFGNQGSVAAYFGEDFAKLWFHPHSTQREQEQLLQYCVLLTRPKICLILYDDYESRTVSATVSMASAVAQVTSNADNSIAEELFQGIDWDDFYDYTGSSGNE